jgi:quercetin dioxygenase-like cupin family protein
VIKNTAYLKELAALHALGALDGDDVRAFADLLAESSEASRAASDFARVPEFLAKSLLPTSLPSSGLKEKILRQAERSKARAQAEAAMKKLVPVSNNGLAFLRESASSGWLALPVAGAFVKMLSFDEASGYAVVLGKLDPGARYPGHTHRHPEDIFMLSGDLHVGDQVIRSGDFHHAEAGSRHGVNWSEQGCVLLAVLSKEDLLAQLLPAERGL